MIVPRPRPGLIICYSYLWTHEYRAGREEGIKDRPCAIVVVTEERQGKANVLVVPVTHAQPADEAAALEIPAALKQHLGLDADRSWVVCSESSLFVWPGPDLRRIGGRDAVSYGVLPPRFFAELRRRFVAHETAVGGRRVKRTE